MTSCRSHAAAGNMFVILECMKWGGSSTSNQQVLIALYKTLFSALSIDMFKKPKF